MRSLLQLTRAHTAPLEVVPAVLGALLATQGELTLSVILWGVFGLLYHLTGYAHNSVSDYNAGYDKGDPHKQHHPMNRLGLVYQYAFSVVVLILFVITLIYTLALVYPNTAGFGLMVIMIASGVGYNLYGKSTKFKFILISIAHSSVFALPYISLGGDITDPVFALAWAYVFLWVVFQIAFSGEIKDIMSDEANLLKELGVKVNNVHEKIRTPGRVIAYSSLLRLSMIILVVGISYSIFTSWAMIAALFSSVILSVSIVQSKYLLSRGDYMREERLKLMSLIESTSLVSFCIILSPITGIGVMTVLILGSFVWLIVLNKIEWGTYLAPRV